MSTILERLATGEVLISDGATGTYLQSHGMKSGECPELLNETDPDLIRGMAAAYLAAGSDMVSTNSFGCSSYKLSEFGLAEKADTLNKAAAALAKEAVCTDGYVAASVGPTGQIAIDEGGLCEPEDMFKAFSKQIAALAEGGADAILIETQTSVIEAVQAVKAAKSVCSLPVIVTFTYEPGARGYRTMMGADPATASQAVVEAGADIVGSNCGNGIENMVEVAKLIRGALPATPIMVQANAGMPVLENGKTVFKDSPEHMAGFVGKLVDAGANIIGGCCGTTPGHITAMKNAVKPAGGCNGCCCCK